MVTRKLRSRKPINYYEPEEPPQDAYEFCEECNDFVAEYCTLHGGLLVIPDDRVPTGQARPALPRAMLTVPAAFLYIDSSSIPGAGLGVFAKTTLPCGVRFGPYRGRRLPASELDSHYGWQVSGRGAHVLDGANPAHSNWMRYVNCARHRVEQNLIAYQYHRDIYYRTIKTIRPGRELFVFYGNQFAAQLNIDLGKYNKSPAQLMRLMGNMSTKNHIQDAPTINLADSLNSTSAELRRVNACVMGMINLEKYFNKPPSDDPKQNEMEFLAMLESFDNLEKTNLERTNTVNVVSEELNVSSTTANDDAVIILDNNNNYQELNNKNDGDRIVENNELSEDGRKFDSKKAKSTWKCEECNELLSSRERLRIHRREHRNAQKFSCKICGYKTDAKHYYKRHTLAHDEFKVSSTEKPEVTDQNKTQARNARWQCEECHQEFKTRATLRRHRRIHADAQRFKCEICEYRTDEPHQFERHKRSNHRVRAEILKCDRCQFSSRNPKAFKIHRALHANAAAIRCEHCAYLSLRLRDMRAHFKRAHAPLHRACRICARAFPCDEYLRRHLNSMHAAKM